MRVAKKGSSIGKAPNKGTYTMGKSSEKEKLGGNITRGHDLRGLPGKNAGKMPKSM